MSVKLAVQGKALHVLQKEAERHSVTPTVVAKAIIDTILMEGLVDQTLAGVDLDRFTIKGRGSASRRGNFTFRGKRCTLETISRLTGVPANVIRGRLMRGWDMERAATTPKMPKGFPNGRATQ